MSALPAGLCRRQSGPVRHGIHKDAGQLGAMLPDQADRGLWIVERKRDHVGKDILRRALGEGDRNRGVAAPNVGRRIEADFGVSGDSRREQAWDAGEFGMHGMSRSGAGYAIARADIRDAFPYGDHDDLVDAAAGAFLLGDRHRPRSLAGWADQNFRPDPNAPGAVPPSGALLPPTPGDVPGDRYRF